MINKNEKEDNEVSPLWWKIMNKNIINQNIDREKIIVKTSSIGILANLLLSLFKVIVGFSVKSITILMDALNNLTDAMSS